MDPQALDLGKRAARASVTYAAMAAVAFIAIELLSKIPLVGVLFFCVNGLLSLAAFFAIAYLVAPTLGGYPAGQTKAMVALYIGLGVAVAVTAGFLIANLITGTLGVIVGSAFGGAESAFGNTVGGVTALLLRLIGSLFFGLIVGSLLAFLGSYIALDRHKSLQEVARPF